ncbi:MAG: hypothetical protein Q9185_003794 [Variospora sp. 1 TL-2023]
MAYNVSLHQPAIGPQDHLEKRDGDCRPLLLGSGPLSIPDNPQTFSTNPVYSSLALGATTPDGYSSIMQNLDAYLDAPNYISNTTLTSYDTLACASLCNRLVGCQAFNLYIERDPTLDPNTVLCPNPLSTTNFLCTLWGTAVSPAQATNRGYLRASFRVAIAGSNAYNKAPPPPSVPCYAGPTAFGGAIKAPKNALGQDTFLGTRFYPFTADQAYNASMCAAYCSEVTGYNSRHPAADGSYKTCAFFNPYALTKNGVPSGFQCALYTDVWDASYGTNYGYITGLDRFTISRSFGYSLQPAGAGRPLSCPPVTSSSSSSSVTSTSASSSTSTPVVTSSSSSSSSSVTSLSSSSSTSASSATSTTTVSMTTSSTATISSTTTVGSTTSQTTTTQATTSSTTSQQGPTTSSTSSTIGTTTTSTSTVLTTSTTSAASTPTSTTTSSPSSSTTSSVSSTTSSSSAPTTLTTSSSRTSTSSTSTSTSVVPFITGFCLQNPSTGEYAHLSRGGNGLEFGPKSAESLPSLYTLDASSRLVSTVTGLIAVLDLPTFGQDGSSAGYTLGVDDDQLGTCPTYEALVCDVSTGDLQCRSAANYIDPVKTPATRSQVYTLADGNNGVDRLLFAPASGAVAVKVRPGADCGMCAITYS